ncbi:MULTISPECIES: FtsX-like permease family protein [Glycomyces]|uniref:ABC transport system permease protein n=2 Tax=Glycomyces TaxID=58113 RepID=A0A9X3PI50_9ACTN|nr:FtsX-like permease family protein [Glycomyces lechevalierae]MDA1384108.1 FtsX-like permease family protein [Glycomyces lechevalierae]MDR7339463.1 putative ABC transport system permease protein [Glycomyces lechevalierae]
MPTTRREPRKASPAFPMLGPSLSMARKRIGGLIAVACAVMGGAAMVTATAVLAETGVSSHLPADRLAAADLIIAADQAYPLPENPDLPFGERVPVPADLAAQAAAVPGVASAVPDLSFTVDLGGSTLEGHNWQTSSTDPVDGEAPDGPGELALDTETAAAQDLAVGDTVTVTTASDTGDYAVTGLVDAPGVHFDPATATALAAHPGGGVDLIAVTVDGDLDTVAADLREALAGRGVNVITGDAIGDAETIAGGTALAELIALAGALSGTVVLLVGFITAGALSVSVANQRRDLALLRAVGATPRQVRRLIATQASAAALVALVPGVALGYVVAERFIAVLTEAGIVPNSLPLALSPISGVAAAVLLLVTVQLAARGASRRASKMSATEAVAESRAEPRRPGAGRTVAGFALLGIALAQSALPLFVRNEAAFISAATATMMAVIGLALAGPVIVRGVTGVVRKRLTGATPAPIWLAVNNSHAFSLRTAGQVTVLALAIGLTTTQLYSQTTLSRTIAGELAAGTAADATVTGPVTADDIADLATQNGVDAAVPLVATTVIREYDVMGDTEAEVTPTLALGPGADRVIDPGVTEGSLADLRGDTVAVSTATAGLWDVGVGDRLELVLADGATAEAAVVAVYERGFGFGGLIASTDLLAAHSGPRLYDTVLVDGDTEAATAWAATQPGVSAAAGDTALRAPTGFSPDQWINLLVMFAMTGYVLLGVGNSLAAATTRRRGEFAALRVIGATPHQIRHMVRREAAITAAIAVGAGLLISVLPMSLLGIGFMGRPWPQGPLWVIPAVAVITTFIAYAAVAIPTRQALQVPPTMLLAAVD